MMNKFTDEELARLKFNIQESDMAVCLEPSDAENLLARLEAAEAIVKIDDTPCRYDHEGYCQNHFISNPCEYVAWRKSCGREAR